MIVHEADEPDVLVGLFSSDVLARELGVSRKSICKWRERYRGSGAMALRRAERVGQPCDSAKAQSCS